MKILINDEQFKKSKSRENIPCECDQCHNTFYKTKHAIQLALWKKQKFEDGDKTRGTANAGGYCSKKCLGEAYKLAQIVECKNCGAKFEKTLAEIKKYPNSFCNQSCAATYNNKHKKYGTRRSKLECYLEEQIIECYPDLICLYNNHEIIDSELDFYFPELKLAIELNGILHYEPIYGDDKLERIQNNDLQKSRLCYEHGIEFCVIDSSKCSYLTLDRKKEFWEIMDGMIKKVYNRKQDCI